VIDSLRWREVVPRAVYGRDRIRKGKCWA